MKDLLVVLLFWAIAGCATAQPKPIKKPVSVSVSVSQQKLFVVDHGKAIKNYPVSTSMFGLGYASGSYKTPLGDFRVHQKIGEGLPLGAVFRYRHFTGEVLPVNAPRRNSIVTRIMRLDGLGPQNRNTLDRGIYIHGTSFEKRVGRPGSYGCVGMRSADIVELFNIVPDGALVSIKL